MIYLLDTHTFIWYDNEPQKLSKLVTSTIRDSSNVLMLSMASVWEIQIKVQVGKLKLSKPLQEVIQQQQQQNNLQLLPIALPHVLAVGSLPMHHRDPFDRC
jgi:PIN domain nuclease of toxin-antitoxin system